MLFARKKSPLLSLSLVFCSYYLLQKVTLYLGVLNFNMDLPLCDGHSAIFTCIDRLAKYCRLIPYFVGEGASECLFSCKALL